MLVGFKAEYIFDGYLSFLEEFLLFCNGHISVEVHLSFFFCDESFIFPEYKILCHRFCYNPQNIKSFWRLCAIFFVLTFLLLGVSVSCHKKTLTRTNVLLRVK